MTIDNDTDELYKVVQKYIEKLGGKILIIGGVEIIELPEDNPYIYHFSVRIMGSKPTLSNIIRKKV